MRALKTIVAMVVLFCGMGTAMAVEVISAAPETTEAAIDTSTLEKWTFDIDQFANKDFHAAWLEVQTESGKEIVFDLTNPEDWEILSTASIKAKGWMQEVKSAKETGKKLGFKGLAKLGDMAAGKIAGDIKPIDKDDVSKETGLGKNGYEAEMERGTLGNKVGREKYDGKYRGEKAYFYALYPGNECTIALWTTPTLLEVFGVTSFKVTVAKKDKDLMGDETVLFQLVEE